MEYLKNAAVYDPDDPHYSYVYAIGLNSQQQPERRWNSLRKPSKRHPYDRNILYSLATISMENSKNEEALKYAEKLV